MPENEGMKEQENQEEKGISKPPRLQSEKSIAQSMLRDIESRSGADPNAFVVKADTSIDKPNTQVETPIGAAKRASITTPAQIPSAASRSQASTSEATEPVIGTPAAVPRPKVGALIVAKPVVGTSGSTIDSTRQPIGSPAGVSESSVATAAKPAVSAAPRPAVSNVAKPAAKPPDSKAEISRRNFIKGLAVLGGIVAVGQFVTFGHYLQGSVGQSNISTQALEDSTTGATLKTTNSNVSSPNSWTAFVYPRTGNPNIDNDTFRQCVLIHLPKGWTAGQYGAVDPTSGDTFVALSRVCVHLWCLWSYVPADDRGICPCHGSQYIPGGPAGTKDANNPGLAVAGPASLQTAPNNQLPVITLSISSNGTISATGVVGQIGCGQKC